MSQIAIIGLVGKSMFFDVPRFHEGGETIHAVNFHEEWGGKGFNQAVAAARQGAHVSFLGKVGNAADSEAVCAVCEAEGIAPVVYFPSPAGRTACAAIMTDGTGRTRVTVAPGDALDTADVEHGFRDAIASADVLLLNNEVPDEVNIRASLIAAESGAKVIFNPAPSRPLPAELAGRVALWTPNEFEEAALGDVPGEIVTTLGAEGCRIRSTRELVRAPEARAVDTTGAGDTFTATLAVYLAEGAELREACAAANAAAAESVEKKYVMPSIPRRIQHCR